MTQILSEEAKAAQAAQGVQAKAILTCPNDGSTDFRHVPKDDPNPICEKCGLKFTPEDLVGTRFEFLKAAYAKERLPK